MCNLESGVSVPIPILFLPLSPSINKRLGSSDEYPITLVLKDVLELLLSGSGHITASGNISSSGQITSVGITGSLSASGNATFANHNIQAVNNIHVEGQIRHKGDTNTHFSFPDDDIARITAGNVPFIDAEKPNPGIPILKINNNANTSFQTRVIGYSTQEPNLLFIDGEQNKNRIGIGTNTPDSKLHIEITDTTTNAVSNEYENYNLALRNNTDTLNAFAGIAFDVSSETDADSIGAAIKGINANATSTNHDTHLTFHTNDAADSGLTERMRIKNDGIVRIGSSGQVAKKLNVAGAVSASAYFANGNGFLFGDGTTNQLTTNLVGNVNEFNPAGDSTVTHLNQLDLNGGHNIDLEGDDTSNLITLSFKPGGDYGGVLAVVRNDSTNPDKRIITPSNAFTFNKTGNNEIRVSGDVIAFHSSDKRLKDNIKLISNPLDKILKIGGYTFDWSEKQNMYEGQDIGVIAQEIEKVLPEVVEKRDNGYKAVKYEKIVPLLIESIKEQQKQIEELKKLIK